MAKLVLSDLATTLSNNAATTINANSDAIEAALENTLSRDGTTPNQMAADIDLNHNDLLNVGLLQADSLTVNGDSIDGLIAEVEVFRDEAEGFAQTAAASATSASISATTASTSATTASNSAANAAASATAAQGYAQDAEDAATTVNTLWTNLQGGTTGQVMQKNSATDYDFSWVFLAGTGDMVRVTYDPQNINADAFARANHTGTQSADSITDGTTNKAYTATEKTKLAGIATGATANSSDATLLNRANHTGTQAISTVTNLQTTLDSKLDDSQASVFGLSLLDDVDAAAARTTLGLGSLATASTINNANWSGTDLAVANGGTGGSDAATARTNLGLVIGTNVQAFDAALASIAGLTTSADQLIYTTAADTYATASLTSVARSLLDDTTTAAMRTTLGLGTIATQASSSVSITGGSVTGITDLAVADGGTGASNAASARINLGITSAGTMAETSGSWTPGVSFGGGTTGITYSLQSGSYFRIGFLVFFSGRLTLSNKGSSTGSALITGLPLASTAYGGVSIPFYLGMAGLNYPPLGRTGTSGTTIALNQQLGATGVTDITDANFTNTSDIIVSGVYNCGSLT